jgi:hypothetical protein
VPHQIHLKQPILRLDIAEAESRIGIALRFDRWDAMRIAGDRDRGVYALYGDGAVGLR